MATTSKDQIHSALNSVVDAAAQGAHEHEGAKVERLRAHAATLHMCIDDIQGMPNLVRIYTDLGNGKHDEALFVADALGNPVEKYEPSA